MHDESKICFFWIFTSSKHYYSLNEYQFSDYFAGMFAYVFEESWFNPLKVNRQSVVELPRVLANRRYIEAVYKNGDKLLLLIGIRSFDRMLPSKQSNICVYTENIDRSRTFRRLETLGTTVYIGSYFVYRVGYFVNKMLLQSRYIHLLCLQL